ncbi:hypothetical protein [Nocardia colli]|uniref:hypothetical protein n=1 Tax=Nocardia colli TaxID=2545717 RepID=UPI0035E13482
MSRSIGTPLDEIAYAPGAGCGANVPIDDHLSLMVFADGKLDQCAAVRDVARSVAPHRSERALRTTSPRAHMNSRLAALDPCAVLGKIGDGHHPALVSNYEPAAGPNRADTTNPWACSFRLDHGDDSTLQDIRYRFTNEHFTPQPGSAERETRIGGLPALENPQPETPRSPGSCTLDVSTTPQPARPGADRYNPISDAWSSEFIAIEASGGCAAARATAEELVRLYNQLPG